ncbi:Transcriptional regulator, MarR family [Alteracholeplasma palmae J233]|uniref:Transcriptional regulator, MarR family n=1 Tax=Alteracholeplasma palmae (strain ATCC 49389 / J233) TaxID=1318466 RepID=U4KLC6_ALTPJ|nr:MarR family winged helix-turn-helix transcriptional regulator [Alteracholeplasma palmae]CCV64598.1 Transcriptional regulator, MarR family [Alteracholeplasma palmae J233]
MDKNHIAKVFFIITNKFRRYLDKKNQKINLSNGQARVLRYIYENTKDDKEVFQKDILEAFSIRGASVNGLIEGLIKLDCIKREIDMSDKRKKKLKMTSNGNLIVLKSYEIILEFENSLKSSLQVEELEQLEKILLKLENEIDAREKEDV